MRRRMLMRWSFILLPLLLQFLTDSPQLLGTFLSPCRDWMMQSAHWVEETCLLRYRRSQFSADWQRYKSLRNEYCCSLWEKVLPLYLPWQLIPRSNSEEISVPLAHNSPLLLYLCMLEILPSWIIIFLPSSYFIFLFL